MPVVLVGLEEDAVPRADHLDRGAAALAEAVRPVLLLCAPERALDLLFEYLAVGVGVTLRQISIYL